jgi:hypothetical protein
LQFGGGRVSVFVGGVSGCGGESDPAWIHEEVVKAAIIDQSSHG